MKKIQKVDISKLSRDEADKLGDQIGEKIRKKVDKTVEEVNAFLKIYGMKAMMQVAIEPLKNESKEQ